MLEVEKGWLKGPLAWDEVPVTAPVSKRFGLMQKHRIRLIDDFSESSVNDTVSVAETPKLHTVDIACSALAFWFSQCASTRVEPVLVARAFDLSSAYRQVASNESGRNRACIKGLVSKDWSIFQANILPFGSIKNVHSFLRAARATWWLGVVGCQFFWSSFFDDYIVFSPPQLGKNSELSAIALFKLLGWIFAQDGGKCKPFTDTCEALGVVFDLSDW